MKKTLKTLVSLGLVVCMLAGCGGNTTEKEENSSVSSTSKADQSESEVVDEQESAYPDYLNLDGYRPIVKEGEEITLRVGVVRSDAAQGTAEDSWFCKYIEEVLNINLEVIEMTSSDLSEKKNLMFASGDLPDMMFTMGISNSEIVQYGVEGGLLLPVSDYLDETLTPNLLYTLETYETSAGISTAPDGKMYTIADSELTSEGRGGLLGMTRVFVDTNYMEAVGVETLPDTLDGFVEFLRKLKEQDPSSYPVIDAAGGFYFERYLFNAFGWTATSNDMLTPVWDVETESIEVPALTEKYGEYLKVMNTLYTEGILHPDYFTMDEITARSYFAERSAALLCDGAPYLSVSEGWDEYISVTPLSSDWCETGISVAGDEVTRGEIFISADTEYPELCMRLMDYLYSAEGSLYAAFGPSAEDEEALLGLKGFTASEDGTAIVYQDAADSAYGDEYTWRISDINLFYMDINVLERTDYRAELTGVPFNYSLDLTNPDQNYRYQVSVAQTDYLIDRLPDLYMSVDQSTRYTDLGTVLGNYADAETAKFIVGQRSLDEVDEFLEELMAMGGEEYLALCRELYANYER